MIVNSAPVIQGGSSATINHYTTSMDSVTGAIPLQESWAHNLMNDELIYSGTDELVVCNATATVVDEDGNSYNCVLSTSQPSPGMDNYVYFSGTATESGDLNYVYLVTLKYDITLNLSTDTYEVTSGSGIICSEEWSYDPEGTRVIPVYDITQITLDIYKITL